MIFEKTLYNYMPHPWSYNAEGKNLSVLTAVFSLFSPCGDIITDSTDDDGENRGRSGTGNAPACTPDVEGTTEKGNIVGPVDQQVVAADIDEVNAHIDIHGGFGITKAAVDGSKCHGQTAEKNTDGHDLIILGGQNKNIGFGTHPQGDVVRQAVGQQGDGGAQQQDGRQRLADEGT